MSILREEIQKQGIPEYSSHTEVWQMITLHSAYAFVIFLFVLAYTLVLGIFIWFVAVPIGAAVKIYDMIGGKDGKQTRKSSGAGN